MGDAVEVPGPDESTLEEFLWLNQLPDELLKNLSGQEAKMLVRLDPSEWPPELTEKVKPYIDLTGEED